MLSGSGTALIKYTFNRSPSLSTAKFRPLYEQINGRCAGPMADFSCASTKRTSHWPAPMSWEAPVRLLVSVVVAALVLAGCNANQEVNRSSRTAPEVFAGHYVDNNPYNPISYAQNNTGRGGGGH
jgi:hypothetical protein